MASDTMDQRRREAGSRLLAAAHEFWTACQIEGQSGAVQWLEGTGGELIIFTRGEYRRQLMAAVDGPHGNTHLFCAETLVNDEEED